MSDLLGEIERLASVDGGNFVLRHLHCWFNTGTLAENVEGLFRVFPDLETICFNQSLWSYLAVVPDHTFDLGRYFLEKYQDGQTERSLVMPMMGMKPALREWDGGARSRLPSFEYLKNYLLQKFDPSFKWEIEMKEGGEVPKEIIITKGKARFIVNGPFGTGFRR